MISAFECSPIHILVAEKDETGHAPSSMPHISRLVQGEEAHLLQSVRALLCGRCCPVGTLELGLSRGLLVEDGEKALNYSGFFERPFVTRPSCRLWDFSVPW